MTFQYRFEGDSIINGNQYKVIDDSGGTVVATQFLAREDTLTKQVYFYCGVYFLQFISPHNSFTVKKIILI